MVAGAAEADHPLRRWRSSCRRRFAGPGTNSTTRTGPWTRRWEQQDATLDLLLAMASLATAERRFGQANELYDAAVLRFGAEVVEPRLLREVPGNLLWRWTRQLAVTDKRQALSVLDQALQRGINGKGEFPAKKATAERAQILEDLGRDDEAAEAYHIGR